MTPEETNTQKIINRRSRHIIPYIQGTTSILGVMSVILFNLFALSLIAFIVERIFNIRMLLQISVMFLLPGYFIFTKWRKRSLHSKAKEYLNIIGSNNIFPITKLANDFKKNDNKVRAELNNMIENGILPDAYIDYEKDSIGFTDDNSNELKQYPKLND